METFDTLRRGLTPVLVLALLEERSKYGYELCKEIEAKSAGEFSFKHGTLYPVLHDLVERGLLVEEWRQPESGRARRYYAITPTGLTKLEESRAEWKRFMIRLQPVLG
jgi:PadR family transcriptional regulator PadR